MIYFTKNSENAPRHASVLISLLLVLITASVYWQVHKFNFINYDDNEYVYDNPHVQDGITFDAIAWAFTTEHSSNWHPVTWLSHMLDCQMFGLWAGGHHLTSLLFHIINALLLFFVFRKMTGNLWQSAVAAAIFAVHPLHIQSVAWVSERKDVLSAFFWMLTLWAYLRYVRRPEWTRYAMLLLFFILGLMSKPMVVTLPFVLLLLDYWPLNRLRLDGSEKNLPKKAAGLLREKIPLFILAFASAGITYYVQQTSGAVKSFGMIPLTDRLLNILISYVNYLVKTAYPFKLSAFYPYPNAFSVWEVAAAGVALLAVTGIAMRLMQHAPYVIVGWLWFLGTLVPVIGLVQVGIQSMADRYMYLPMIGLLIPVSWGIPEILSKLCYRKMILSASAACIIIFLFWGTKTQLGYWTDTDTLFSRAIAVTENNYLAYNIVGDELGGKGDYDRAEQFFLTALKIKPDDADALEKLGQVAFHKKNYDKALNYYQKAILRRPDNAKILNMIGKTYYHLGLLASKQGKIKDAFNNYKKAVTINPNYGNAHKCLADLLFSKGDMIHALEHYSEALKINPDDATTHYNIGVVLFQQQKIKTADEHFYKAVQLDHTYEKAKIALTMTRKMLSSNNIVN